MMARNQTLSGKPVMSEARRQHVHGPLQGWSDIIDSRPYGELNPIAGVAFLSGALALLFLALAAFAIMNGGFS